MTLKQHSHADVKTKELEKVIRDLTEEIRVKELSIESARQELLRVKMNEENFESDRKKTDEIEKLKQNKRSRSKDAEAICEAIVYALARKSASKIGAVCKEHGLHIGFVKDKRGKIVIGLEGQYLVRTYPDEYFTRRLEKYLASVEPVDLHL